MRLGKKSVAYGASAMLVGAMIAIVAVWDWSPILGGPSSNAGVTWNVELVDLDHFLDPKEATGPSEVAKEETRCRSWVAPCSVKNGP